MDRTGAINQVWEFARSDNESLDCEFIDLCLDYTVWPEERVEELEEKAHGISLKFATAFAQVAANEGLTPIRGARTMALAMIHSATSALMYANNMARGGMPPPDQEAAAWEEVMDELDSSVEYARALSELAGRPTKQ